MEFTFSVIKGLQPRAQRQAGDTRRQIQTSFPTPKGEDHLVALKGVCSLGFQSTWKERGKTHPGGHT